MHTKLLYMGVLLFFQKINYSLDPIRDKRYFKKLELVLVFTCLAMCNEQTDRQTHTNEWVHTHTLELPSIYILEVVSYVIFGIYRQPDVFIGGGNHRAYTLYQKSNLRNSNSNIIIV